MHRASSAVVAAKTRNGGVSAEPRISISATVKSDTERRSGIPADFPEHSEAGAGETSSPPDMATENRRGILSMFRRKKDTKGAKPVAVISST